MSQHKYRVLLGAIIAPLIAQASPFEDWQSTMDSHYLCKGYYAPPLHGFEDRLTLQANQIRLTLNKDIYLEGDVALFWQEHEIYARDIALSQNEQNQWQYLNTQNPFLYQTPLWAFYGQQAVFQKDPQYVRLEAAQFRYYPHHAHGNASLLEATKSSLLLLNANYSTCHPRSPTWNLAAKSIKLKPEKGRASARNIVFTVKDVPIFYWPYLNYPIDNQRHSGFLFPHYGTTSQSGLSLTVPYYWNIAPNKDALIGLRWMSERGLEWQTQVRYLNRNHYSTLNYHLLINDKKFDTFQSQTRIAPPEGIALNDPRIQALDQSTTRQGLRWQHLAHWGQYWQGQINFEWVSDDNYFVDLGQDLHTSSQNQLPQRAKVTYQSPHWLHEFGIEEYQILQPISSTLNEELYKRQPYWNFSSHYPFAWKHLSLGLDGQFVNFTRSPDPKTQQTVTTGNRSYLHPHAQYTWSNEQSYITPGVGVHWRYYDLQRGDIEKEQPDTINSFIPEYTVDMGTTFERLTTWRNKPLLQTLSPRAYYAYIPYQDQDMLPVFDSGIITYLKDQLYSPYRYLGKDRIGDVHQVTVGLNAMVFHPSDFQHFLKVELAEIFYLKGRTLQLCEKNLGLLTCYPSSPQQQNHHSDLLLAIDWHQSYLHLGMWSQWDVRQNRVEQSAVYTDYTPTQRMRFNLYYTWTREDPTPQPDLNIYRSNLQQLDFSGYFNIHTRWQILFRSLYDIKYTQFADLVLGFEYNSCCMAVQLIGNRYRLPNNLSQPTEYTNGLFLQVAFKGLSTVGLNQADNQLKRKIPGYTPFGERVKGHVLPH